ncbi:hypothetical protein CEXT_677231 [Caerostris extrusa]|uniref:Uncharacterized protein n=1 Tax=Caerostris extrusa TaxID=172846 RepID=A0AAV4NIP5_CAEEX|nr:hypothetical protein CEXT_677231 [Caerostris extrusa]
MTEVPEPKLPPIMVSYTDNLEDQIAEISNQFTEDVRIKLAGLPVNYSTDEIATGIAELGLKIDQVGQLTNLRTKAPIPVWQIVYRKSPENSKIFENAICRGVLIVSLNGHSAYANLMFCF